MPIFLQFFIDFMFRAMECNMMTGGWEDIRSWPISRYHCGVRLETEDARKYSGSIIDNVSEPRNF